MKKLILRKSIIGAAKVDEIYVGYCSGVRKYKRMLNTHTHTHSEREERPGGKTHNNVMPTCGIGDTEIPSMESEMTIPKTCAHSVQW